MLRGGAMSALRVTLTCRTPQHHVSCLEPPNEMTAKTA
jgi:hypothetical protein